MDTRGLKEARPTRFSFYFFDCPTKNVDTEMILTNSYIAPTSLRFVTQELGSTPTS